MDFSRHSGFTTPYVLGFASDLGARVHILHVIDESFRWETQPYELEVERRPGYTIEDEVQDRVNELANQAKEAGVDAVPHLRESDIRDEILLLIDELDVR